MQKQIALLYSPDPEGIEKVFIDNSISYRRLGNVFLLQWEEFLSVLSELKEELLRDVRISFAKPEELKDPNKLLEIGFRARTLDQLSEEELFKNLSKILGTAQSYFHAIVCAKSMKIYGFEALCRSQVPVFKLFNVSNRIALLVDNFCRERAIYEFKRRFLRTDYKLFLNFHPKFLKNPLENAGDLISLLHFMEVSPSRVVVEIDEYEGMDLNSLKMFRNLLEGEGVLVALDDVGAGYAGLYQLTEIKPHIAKLDMELVRRIDKNPMKQSIVKALISACKDVGIMVLAEGVEREEELKFFLEAGVDLFQGFLFARPSPHPNTLEIEKLAYNLLSTYARR